MATSKRSLSNLAPNPENPRRVTPSKLQALERTLKRFGDLSGVVFNRTSGHLVGGHQRIEVFHALGMDSVVLERTFEKPTPSGTVAEGFFEVDGERFAYREVQWGKQTEKAAMICANRGAGDWDMTLLTKGLNELHASGFDMDLTLFNAQELAPYLPDENDLSGFSDAPPSGPGGDADPDALDPSGSAQVTNDVNPLVPMNHVKQVQLYFDEPSHQKFLELTDALKDVYHRSNLSETVLEAIKRASITAATK